LSHKNFNKILIIGLGLIGGSFAKTCKKYKVTNEIFAFDLDQNSIDQAKETNIINGFVSLDDDISAFDLIVLATPIINYDEIILKIINKISPQTILIDLGSVKDLKIKNKLGKNFIPCHPIAGSEKTGFENSTEDLFYNKKFIICSENCDESALKKIENLVKNIGVNVEFLSAKKHDEIYALVSHLPQFLSFLTKEFSPQEIIDESLIKAFRLDNSDPKIWSDIFKLNQKNIEKYYLELFDNLAELMEILASSNIKKLITELNSIKKDEIEFDEKFLTKNFAVIFFRVVLVFSYLKIKDIEKYKNFSGIGFKDFTSIIAILSLENNLLIDLIKKNQKEILKTFETLI
jgi:prephenate dehydrogenase